MGLLFEILLLLQVPEVSDAELARALHWGAVDDAANLSDVLVELGARQIVALDKGYLVLTSQGAVCSIDCSRGGSADAVSTVGFSSSLGLSLYCSWGGEGVPCHTWSPYFMVRLTLFPVYWSVCKLEELQLISWELPISWTVC